MKMNKLTKEDYLKAIEKIEESYGCDMAYYDLHNERDLIKHLINEHFELKEKYEKALDKACECLDKRCFLDKDTNEIMGELTGLVHGTHLSEEEWIEWCLNNE